MLEKPNGFTALDYDVPLTRPTRIKINKKLYAKAVYDNLADTTDELAFKKGDILTVIEQDTDGLIGWWLCTLRGRQGLCPGNRLRILNSYDSGCFSPSPSSSPCPSLGASTATLNSSICSAEIYENASIISSSTSGIGSSNGGSVNIGDIGSSSSSSSNGSGSNACISVSQTQLNNHHHQLPLIRQSLQYQQYQQHQQPLQYRQGTRRSWHVSPNKVITPQRHGDVYIYNCPVQPQQPQQQQQQLHHLQSTPQQQQQQQQIYSNQNIYQNLSSMSSLNGGSGTNNSNSNNEFETYDIPKPATPINYDCPKSVCRTPTNNTTPSAIAAQMRFDAMSLAMKNCSIPIQEESYDVPRPLLNNMLHHQNTLTPSSSNSSLLTSDSMSLSFSSSNRSSLANMPDYDIPRRNPLPVRAVHQLTVTQQQQQQHQKHQQLLLQQQQQQQQQQYHQSLNGNCMTYDFPVPSTQSTPVQEKAPASSMLLNAAVTKELPLELSSALETLAKLQSAATTAITRLLSFVSPNWRVRDKLEPILMEVKLAAVRLRTALHDLTEFGEGTLGNATVSEDRNLALKLRPLVRALRDADKLIHESSNTIDIQGWTVENLSRSDDKTSCKPPDSLDQLIACAQTLTEDVRQTISFVQGNASLLFKRNLPAEEVPNDNVAATQHGRAGHETNTSSGEWLEDYDYVCFESKDAAAKKNSALRDAIPQNLKNKFDTVIKAAETTAMATSNAVPPTINDKKSELTNKDKLLVRYYAVQISTHMGNLQQAIDSFFETVEKNQPPKFFIAYGKFVVVSAHNLVTIGDIVHRNISKVELREKILRCTDALSDALKTCVTKSKKAAAHFPSVTAVQEMVDSVVDISHLASALKTSMLHAVQMTV